MPASSKARSTSFRHSRSAKGVSAVPVPAGALSSSMNRTSASRLVHRVSL
jgi:hypothetical protein